MVISNTQKAYVTNVNTHAHTIHHPAAVIVVDTSMQRQILHRSFARWSDENRRFVAHLWIDIQTTIHWDVNVQYVDIRRRMSANQLCRFVCPSVPAIDCIYSFTNNSTTWCDTWKRSLYKCLLNINTHFNCDYSNPNFAHCTFTSGSTNYPTIDLSLLFILKYLGCYQTAIVAILNWSQTKWLKRV